MTPWESPLVSLHRDGEELLLDGQGMGGFLWMKGTEGLGLAPVEITSTPLARGGSVHRHVRYAAREVFLPVHLSAGSYTEISRMRRQLEDLLDPLRGPVEIRLTFSDGSARSCFGLYKEGLAGIFARDQVGDGWQRLGLTFECEDPWWYGPTRTIARQVAVSRKGFITAALGSHAYPFFPTILSDSTVAGMYDLDIRGDAEAWPVWTITGPGTDLRLELSRPDGTAARFVIDGAFPEVVTIDTRPRRQDVYSATMTDGELWDRVTPDSTLFPLPPGRVRVRMTMVSANPLSEIRLDYRETYKSGH